MVDQISVLKGKELTALKCGDEGILRSLKDVLSSRFPEYGKDGVEARLLKGDARVVVKDTSEQIVGGINITVDERNLSDIFGHIGNDGEQSTECIRTNNWLGGKISGSKIAYRDMDAEAWSNIQPHFHDGQTIIPSIIQSKIMAAFINNHEIYFGKKWNSIAEKVAKYSLRQIATMLQRQGNEYYASMMSPGDGDEFHGGFMRPYIGSGPSTEAERMEARMKNLEKKLHIFAGTK